MSEKQRGVIKEALMGFARLKLKIGTSAKSKAVISKSEVLERIERLIDVIIAPPEPLKQSDLPPGAFPVPVRPAASFKANGDASEDWLDLSRLCAYGYRFQIWPGPDAPAVVVHTLEDGEVRVEGEHATDLITYLRQCGYDPARPAEGGRQIPEAPVPVIEA